VGRGSLPVGAARQLTDPVRTRGKALRRPENERFLRFIPSGTHCVQVRWSPAALSRSLAL